MSTAFIFPGQGSQAVGMGKALADSFPVARAVFEEVDAALGQPLNKIMFEGPESELTLTANAQPALMAVSIAAVRVLESEAGLDLARVAKFVAGHSLGEYSALCAAGSLSLSDTARLLRLRGAAMQAAVPVGEGAMAALLEYLDRQPLSGNRGQFLNVHLHAAVPRDADDPFAVARNAGANGGGQVVVSGSKVAVEKAMELAKERGIKRAVLLPVSAPFHCALMQGAAEAMQAALATAVIAAPRLPLVANVTASPVIDPEQIRRLLVEQVTGAVRWRESIVFMAEAGVTKFVECGAGKVLAGLLKRIAPGVSGISVGAPADLEAYRAYI